MALPILTAIACTRSFVEVCNLSCRSPYLLKSNGYRIWSPPVSINGACKVALVQMPSCILNDPSPDNGSVSVPDATHITPRNIEYIAPLTFFLDPDIPIPTSKFLSIFPSLSSPFTSMLNITFSHSFANQEASPPLELERECNKFVKGNSYFTL
eukprot:scaffold93468_cov74-Attheya_sp.AAC.1